MAIKFSSEGNDRRESRSRSRGWLTKTSSYRTLRKKRIDLDAKSRFLKISLNQGKGRVSEDVISNAIMRYLSSKDGREASLAELRINLPNYIDLSDDDLKASETRPSEPVWAQQIRNVVSHRDAAGSAIANGLLKYHGSGRISITDDGLRAVREMESAQ